VSADSGPIFDQEVKVAEVFSRELLLRSSSISNNVDVALKSNNTNLSVGISFLQSFDLFSKHVLDAFEFRYAGRFFLLIILLFLNSLAV
jgi:hypothetical protein